MASWQSLPGAADGRTQLFSPAFWEATYLGAEDRRAWYFSQLQADAAILPIDAARFNIRFSSRAGRWFIGMIEQAPVPPSVTPEAAKPRWPFASVMFGE